MALSGPKSMSALGQMQFLNPTSSHPLYCCIIGGQRSALLPTFFQSAPSQDPTHLRGVFVISFRRNVRPCSHRLPHQPAMAFDGAANSSEFASAFGAIADMVGLATGSTRSRMMLWTAPTLRHRSAIGWLR